MSDKTISDQNKGLHIEEGDDSNTTIITEEDGGAIVSATNNGKTVEWVTDDKGNVIEYMEGPSSPEVKQ